MDGHLEGVEGQVGVQRPSCLPAQHPPRTGVDRESRVHPAAAGRVTGEVGEPQPVRGRHFSPPKDRDLSGAQVTFEVLYRRVTQVVGREVIRGILAA